jgi:sucrose-6-phosphate hydrolase SacC (GH32 family)
LESLRGEQKDFRNVMVKDGQETTIPFDEQIFDAEMTINVGRSEAITLKIAGQQIEFKPAEKQIVLSNIKAPLDLHGKKLQLRILVDRTSIELFAQNGEVQIAKSFVPNDDNPPRGIITESKNGEVVIDSLKVWKMETVW